MVFPSTVVTFFNCCSLHWWEEHCSTFSKEYSPFSIYISVLCSLVCVKDDLSAIRMVTHTLHPAPFTPPELFLAPPHQRNRKRDRVKRQAMSLQTHRPLKYFQPFFVILNLCIMLNMFVFVLLAFARYFIAPSSAKKHC